MTLIVSKEGTGDYRMVNDALNALSTGGGTIIIKEGVYKEKISVEKPNVTLQGEGQVALTFDDCAKKKFSNGDEYGTFNSASFYVSGCNFSAYNITFENASGSGSVAGQALALYTNGDKQKFYQCRFLSFQDTVFTAPKPPTRIDGSIADDAQRLTHPPEAYRIYFEDCYIEGDVDFIFGGASVYFYRCEIFSKYRESDPCGYITAANTAGDQAFGFVFNECTLTSDCPPNSVYLGRPWRNDAHTAFINCSMGAHIKPEGWHNWNKPDAEKTVRYEEYGSTGPGGEMRGRVSWSKRLTAEEAERYTVHHVLKGFEVQK